jgi:hypothetical protein
MYNYVNRNLRIFDKITEVNLDRREFIEGSIRKVAIALMVHRLLSSFVLQLPENCRETRRRGRGRKGSAAAHLFLANITHAMIDHSLRVGNVTDDGHGTTIDALPSLPVGLQEGSKARDW